MEKKTQLYFGDDDTFQFIKRPLQYSCLLGKDGERLKRGWRHSFSGQYIFHGYKNIPADTITLGYSRDIILDPHNKVPITDDTSGKPRTTSTDIKKWIAQIAETMRYIYRSKRKTTTKQDLLNYCLMGIDTIMAIALVIKYATS